MGKSGQNRETIWGPYDYSSPTSIRIERLPGRPATHPFTREFESWRVDPSVPSPLTVSSGRADTSTSTASKSLVDGKEDPAIFDSAAPPIKFYVPRGPRESWTKWQYTVYKEEKAIYAEEERVRRLELAEHNARRAEKARAGRRILTGNGYKVILAEVKGRENGEEAVPLDPATGLPVLPKAEPPVTATRLKKAAKDVKRAPKLSEEGARLWEAARVPRWLRDPAGEWVVPDTDGEDELGPDDSPMYDEKGAVMPDDYWPSKWRKLIAEEVNDNWIPGDVSLRG